MIINTAPTQIPTARPIPIITMELPIIVAVQAYVIQEPERTAHIVNLGAPLRHVILGLLHQIPAIKIICLERVPIQRLREEDLVYEAVRQLNTKR